MALVTRDLLRELETFAEPGALLAELDRRFGRRMAIACAGQISETALIALAAEAGFTPRVYTLDTLRLFPETYAYFGTLEKHFGIRIERLKPPVEAMQKMVEQQGEYLFFDSKEKQEYCCHVRKVLPNQQMLAELDVWVTGLRADQSASRAALPRMDILELVSPFGAGDPTPSPERGEGPSASSLSHRWRGEREGGKSLLKVNPLVDWTEEQARAYLKQRNVPLHPLQETMLPGGWKYESLGCRICTTPIAPHEPRRAGRWRWFNALDDKKECGLHLPIKEEG